MVDFQKRDTQRGGGDGGDDEPDTEPEEDTHSADHDHHEHDVESVGVAVMTISTSRTLDSDPSGEAIRDAFEVEGHRVVTREVVRDDFDQIQAATNQLVDRRDVDVLITTGGTGVTPDDVTVEAIGPHFDKHLPGFGEEFRRQSMDDIGVNAIATRATAGIVESVPVFVLPGSVDAVTLGVEELVLPVVSHLTGLAHQNHEQ